MDTDTQSFSENRNCAAYGCSQLGTIRVEGGNWVCAGHAGVHPGLWPDMTLLINRFSLLLDAARELQRTSAADPPSEAHANDLVVLLETAGLDVALIRAKAQQARTKAQVVGYWAQRCIVDHCITEMGRINRATSASSTPLGTASQRLERLLAEAANREADRMELAAAAGV